MAYNNNTKPEFRWLKFKHLHGIPHDAIQQEIIDWFEDPAHGRYRYVDCIVNYYPPHAAVSYTGPDKNMWVEITIIYTE